MAAGGEDFDSWLSVKLKALNTDEGVFGSYIKGILAGEEESVEDKTEALEGILSEITEHDIRLHCGEIMEQWAARGGGGGSGGGGGGGSGGVEDVEVRLARMLESRARMLESSAPRVYTDDERRVREAILAQYSQMSDHEEEGERGRGEGEAAEGNGLRRNTNAAVVAQAEKEKRERAKADSQRKKEKDKEDREKQKQLAQEKKEKRKTQKGERRR